VEYIGAVIGWEPCCMIIFCIAFFSAFLCCVDWSWRLMRLFIIGCILRSFYCFSGCLLYLVGVLVDFIQLTETVQNLEVSDQLYGFNYIFRLFISTYSFPVLF